MEICRRSGVTWTHYRTQMPAEEKLVWRLDLEMENEKHWMRKSERYKKMSEMREASGGVLPTPAHPEDV